MRHNAVSPQPAHYWAGQATVCIQLEQVRFPSYKNPGKNDGFTIATARLLRDPTSLNPARCIDHTVTVKGKIPEPKQDHVYKVNAKWELSKPPYCTWDLAVDSAVRIPSDKENEKFISNLSGIGVQGKKKLISVYGATNVIGVIESKGVAAFTDVGISPNLAKKALCAFIEHSAPLTEMQKLHEAGIFGSLCESVLKLAADAGKTLIQFVLDHPAQIMDVDGIGFTTADKLWKICGVPATHHDRIFAGIKEVLEADSRRHGHCYMLQSDMLSAAATLLSLVCLRDIWTTEGLQHVTHKAIAIDDAGYVWLRRLNEAEHIIAAKITALCQPSWPIDDITSAVCTVLARYTFEPSSGQLEALVNIPRHHVCLLTGSAGTGKTSVIKLTIQVFRELGLCDIRLCAPTGAAARRMTNVCSKMLHTCKEPDNINHATTIHSLIGLRPNSAPEYNSHNPLNADVIIVDESSMIDVSLAKDLLCAVKDTAYVIFVGDPYQLPPVGPGCTLHDMIDCKQIPHFTLHRDESYRQQAHPNLLKLANAILDGKELAITNGQYDDIIHYNDTTNEAIIHRTLEIWREHRQDHNQVKFITYRRGKATNNSNKQTLGVTWLNSEIVKDTCGVNSGFKSNNQWFYEGMRCMWRKNDKIVNLVNGQEFTIGRLLAQHMIITNFEECNCREHSVRQCNPSKQCWFDTREINLADYSYPEHFIPGFCNTIHSSQGNEYPVVAYSILPGDNTLLSRESAYTAVTRAVNKLIIVGCPSILWTAKPSTSKRRTRLSERLCDCALYLRIGCCVRTFKRFACALWVLGFFLPRDVVYYFSGVAATVNLSACVRA